jgi:trans-AT polyketide synthase/acyltransferase/oxidoreductase domain-containing protein
MKRATQAELHAEISAWNSKHPIGTAVCSDVYPDRTHKTRTEAMALFDQKAIIYLEGFNGYFDLGEVRPVDQSGVQVGSHAPAAPAGQSSSTHENVSGPRVAVLFPGQGAQKKGMGQDLFPHYPELVRRADEILGYSIERLCLEDPDKQLNLTQYTQPALYVVSALGHLYKCTQDPQLAEADCYLGHSLGEYNALLAAGVFDFETGLRLVVRRGQLMAEASGGAMAAVVRVDVERLRQVLAEHGLDEIDLANYNTPTQTVISGPAEATAKAVDVLGSAGILAVPLKVSAAFHSRYMRDAQERFGAFLQEFEFAAPKHPVIANATALPYAPDAVRETLAAQIVSPVKWTDSVLHAQGAGDVEFIEIGSNILTKMVAEIRAGAMSA